MDWTPERIQSGLARGTDGLLLDVRFAVRMFRQRLGVVSVTVAGLALAIGISTVVFGLVQALFLRRIEMPDPASVVEVHRVAAGGRTLSSMGYSEYVRLRDHVSSVRLEAWASGSTPFGEASSEEVPLGLVSGDFFETLGIGASLGRALAEDDSAPMAAPAAVVTHAFWKQRLGGDQAIVGRSVRLLGTAFVVVGVLEEGFNGFPGRATAAFWVPAAVHARPSVRQPPDELSMLVVGRLVDGATRQRAEDEIAAAITALAAEGPPGELEVAGARLSSLHDPLAGPGGRALRWTLGAIAAILGIVLLLACTNVANVLLANAISRRREVGVRLALGASRGRLARQLMTESLMLGALGGGLGLLLAAWFLPVVAALLELPWTNPVTLDLRFFGFGLVFTLLSSLGAGLAPARNGAHGDLATPLKGDAPAGRRTGKPGRARSVLVGVQAAASVALLVLAALLTRAVVHATRYELGFDPERLVTVSPSLDDAGYDAGRAADYWDRAVERVAVLPGVEQAALVGHLPLGGSWGRTERVEQEGGQSSVYFNNVSTTYFATAGIPILRGRTFTAAEVAAGTPVAVISEGLARRFWENDEALGTTLERVAEDLSETQVVGIVGNVPPLLRELDADMLYRPLVRRNGLGSILWAHLLVRSTGDAAMVLRPVREAIRALDPDVLPRAALARDAIDERLRQLRLNVTMAGFLGTVALVLACIGVFSVTAFAVELRTGEIGVRRSLGASAGDVVRQLVRDSLRPVVAGLVLGLLGTLAGTRVVSAVLYGVSPHDPLAILAAVAILLTAAAVAAGLASRRAARVDPIVVLRR